MEQTTNAANLKISQSDMLSEEELLSITQSLNYREQFFYEHTFLKQDDKSRELDSQNDSSSNSIVDKNMTDVNQMDLLNNKDSKNPENQIDQFNEEIIQKQLSNDKSLKITSTVSNEEESIVDEKYSVPENHDSLNVTIDSSCVIDNQQLPVTNQISTCSFQDLDSSKDHNVTEKLLEKSCLTDDSTVKVKSEKSSLSKNLDVLKVEKLSENTLIDSTIKDVSNLESNYNLTLPVDSKIKNETFLCEVNQEQNYDQNFPLNADAGDKTFPSEMNQASSHGKNMSLKAKAINKISSSTNEKPTAVINKLHNMSWLHSQSVLDANININSQFNLTKLPGKDERNEDYFEGNKGNSNYEKRRNKSENMCASNENETENFDAHTDDQQTCDSTVTKGEEVGSESNSAAERHEEKYKMSLKDGNMILIDDDADEDWKEKKHSNLPDNLLNRALNVATNDENTEKVFVDKFGRVDGCTEKHLFMGPGGRRREQEFLQAQESKPDFKSHPGFIQKSDNLNTLEEQKYPKCSKSENAPPKSENQDKPDMMVSNKEKQQRFIHGRAGRDNDLNINQNTNNRTRQKYEDKNSKDVEMKNQEISRNQNFSDRKQDRFYRSSYKPNRDENFDDKENISDKKKLNQWASDNKQKFYDHNHHRQLTNEWYPENKQRGSDNHQYRQSNNGWYPANKQRGSDNHQYRQSNNEWGSENKQRGAANYQVKQSNSEWGPDKEQWGSNNHQYRQSNSQWKTENRGKNSDSQKQPDNKFQSSDQSLNQEKQHYQDKKQITKSSEPLKNQLDHLRYMDDRPRSTEPAQNLDHLRYMDNNNSKNIDSHKQFDNQKFSENEWNANNFEAPHKQLDSSFSHNKSKSSDSQRRSENKSTFKNCEPRNEQTDSKSFDSKSKNSNSQKRPENQRTSKTFEPSLKQSNPKSVDTNSINSDPLKDSDNQRVKKNSEPMQKQSDLKHSDESKNSDQHPNSQKNVETKVLPKSSDPPQKQPERQKNLDNIHRNQQIKVDNCQKRSDTDQTNYNYNSNPSNYMESNKSNDFETPLNESYKYVASSSDNQQNVVKHDLSISTNLNRDQMTRHSTPYVSSSEPGKVKTNGRFDKDVGPHKSSSFDSKSNVAMCFEGNQHVQQILGLNQNLQNTVKVSVNQLVDSSSIYVSSCSSEQQNFPHQALKGNCAENKEAESIPSAQSRLPPSAEDVEDYWKIQVELCNQISNNSQKLVNQYNKVSELSRQLSIAQAELFALQCESQTLGEKNYHLQNQNRFPVHNLINTLPINYPLYSMPPFSACPEGAILKSVPANLLKDINVSNIESRVRDCNVDSQFCMLQNLPHEKFHANAVPFNMLPMHIYRQQQIQTPKFDSHQTNYFDPQQQMKTTKFEPQHTTYFEPQQTTNFQQRYHYQNLQGQQYEMNIVTDLSREAIPPAEPIEHRPVKGTGHPFHDK